MHPSVFARRIPPRSPAPMAAGETARAAATLLRATDFLRGGLHPAMRGAADGTLFPSTVRARVQANALAELDRFLHVLLDEVTRADGRHPTDAQRNTPNKLRDWPGGLPARSAGYARLRALGRTRACLFHCGGIVRSGDRPGAEWMTAGWSAGPARPDELRRYALGERLLPSSGDLAQVCDFYDRIARDIMGIDCLPGVSARADQPALAA